MAQKIITCEGLPGSGKSYWACAQVEQHPDRYKRINRDDLRRMIDSGKWSKGREELIRLAELSLAELYFSNGYTVIIDDCNLSFSAKTMWRELARKMKTAVEIQDFTNVPLETCIERDLKRLHSVGEKVIRDMYRQYLYKPAPAPQYDHALPDAIICDLDGTLALLNGRNPYDTAQCEKDLLNEPVADIVKAFLPEFVVLFTSGRSSQYCAETERWLHSHCFSEPYGTFHLFMRPEGDSRKDAIVKKELYEQHIQGRYNIKFVLDDRSQMIVLWRSLGLTCLQVADGEY